MSGIVGPSQRVCSSPTFVSTTTGARSTPVASWRPPRPGLDDRDLDPAPRELVERRGGDQLELGHAVAGLQPAVDLRGGRGGALHGGAERVGLEVGVADPDPLGEGRQVRREERAGADAVRLEQRGGHADRRALAVRADDVDRGEALLRRAERGQQPAHPLQAEAHAEQLEAEQVLLGALGASSVTARRAPRAAARACRARPATTGLGRLGHEALVGELLLGARDLGVQPGAALLDPARGGAEVDGVGRQHGDRAARHRDRRDRLAAAGDHSQRASRATCSAVRS